MKQWPYNGTLSSCMSMSLPSNETMKTTLAPIIVLVLLTVGTGKLQSVTGLNILPPNHKKLHKKTHMRV
jgi:hypothetical protein